MTLPRRTLRQGLRRLGSRSPLSALHCERRLVLWADTVRVRLAFTVIRALTHVQSHSGGQAADRYGRLNVLVTATALSGILCLAFWLPSRGAVPLVLFACFYGVYPRHCQAFSYPHSTARLFSQASSPASSSPSRPPPWARCHQRTGLARASARFSFLSRSLRFSERPSAAPSSSTRRRPSTITLPSSQGRPSQAAR